MEHHFDSDPYIPTIFRVRRSWRVSVLVAPPFPCEREVCASLFSTSDQGGSLTRASWAMWHEERCNSWLSLQDPDEFVPSCFDITTRYLVSGDEATRARGFVTNGRSTAARLWVPKVKVHEEKSPSRFGAVGDHRRHRPLLGVENLTMTYVSYLRETRSSDLGLFDVRSARYWHALYGHRTNNISLGDWESLLFDRAHRHDSDLPQPDFRLSRLFRYYARGRYEEGVTRSYSSVVRGEVKKGGDLNARQKNVHSLGASHWVRSSRGGGSRHSTPPRMAETPLTLYPILSTIMTKIPLYPTPNVDGTIVAFQPFFQTSLFVRNSAFLPPLNSSPGRRVRGTHSASIRSQISPDVTTSTLSSAGPVDTTARLAQIDSANVIGITQLLDNILNFRFT